MTRDHFTPIRQSAGTQIANSTATPSRRTGSVPVRHRTNDLAVAGIVRKDAGALPTPMWAEPPAPAGRFENSRSLDGAGCDPFYELKLQFLRLKKRIHAIHERLDPTFEMDVEFFDAEELIELFLENCSRRFLEDFVANDGRIPHAKEIETLLVG